MEPRGGLSGLQKVSVGEVFDPTVAHTSSVTWAQQLSLWKAFASAPVEWG